MSAFNVSTAGANLKMILSRTPAYWIWKISSSIVFFRCIRAIAIANDLVKFREKFENIELSVSSNAIHISLLNAVEYKH